MPITLPVTVARNIFFNKMHPVAAWREFYGIEQNELAQLLECDVSKVTQLESSNLHIKDDWKSSLCGIFKIKAAALEMRYTLVKRVYHSSLRWNDTTEY